MQTSLTKQRFNEIISKWNDLPAVLVIGDIGLDKYTFGDVKRISPEAPVPVLEVIKEWNKLGLAANVTDNLKSLGVQSTIMGVVGDDIKASQLESLLEERGLKTWGVIRDSERHTTFKERITTSTQQICRVDYETKEEIGKETYQKLHMRLEEFNDDHGSLVIEDYGKGLLTKEALSYLIKSFTEKKKLIGIDPSRTTDPRWYEGADLLKPNLDEAKLMTEALGYFKEENLEQVAAILMEKLKLKKLIITLGPQGMGMIDSQADGKWRVIPTVANEVFDVSGAGDTAIAAIMSSLAAGASLEEAAWIGNCASGVVVRKRGTALCEQAELKEFFEILIKGK